MSREAFFTLHRGLPREGPGERADVSWAAETVGLKPDARICDAACGPGADIPALLFHAPDARLTGFDLTPHFVDAAAERFARDNRVTILRARLIETADDDLPGLTSLGPFDLIWCAGAIYFHGISESLSTWRAALAPDGAIAFSQACWFTDTPSEAAKSFWAAEYPQMTNAAGISAQVADARFRTIATRRLADPAWEGYYAPMERRIAALRPGAGADLTQVLDEAAEEARIWRQYRHEFGYLLSVVRPV